MIHFWRVKDWFDPLDDWTVYQSGPALVAVQNGQKPVILTFNQTGIALMVDVWSALYDNHPDEAMSMLADLEDDCEPFD